MLAQLINSYELIKSFEIGHSTVNLFMGDNGKFVVRAGNSVASDLTYTEACHELGEMLMNTMILEGGLELKN